MEAGNNSLTSLAHTNLKNDMSHPSLLSGHEIACSYSCAPGYVFWVKNHTIYIHRQFHFNGKKTLVGEIKS